MSSVQQPAGAPAAAPPEAGNRSARFAVPAVALAVAAVVVLAVVVWTYSSRTHHAQNNAASYLASSTARQAEAAAVRGVTATLTYNYKTLSADFANAEKSMTPRFRANYAHTTATSVEPLAKKYSAISTANVSASGVSSAAPNAVGVLVFANQTVQNTQLAHPRLDRTRIKVSMVKLNGSWLIDNLSPI